MLPDTDSRPEFWGDEARQGVAILNLTSWKALRWMYSLPAGQRKGVGLDEIQFLNAVPSGRLMITEFGRNTRKQNLVVLAAGQDPGDTLLDTRGGNNFVGGAFLGRMDDLDAAGRALRIAQIPTGVGYENSLLDLPKPTDDNPDVPRQFLMYNRGGTGFKEIITVSRAGRAHRLDLAGPGIRSRAAVHRNPGVTRSGVIAAAAAARRARVPSPAGCC